MNSWHFEETKLDEWGRARLKELLHRAPVSQYLEVDGLELDLDAKIVVREVKGDCWVHVRKGKKVGHDFDCAIDWAGSIRGGSGLQIHGFAEELGGGRRRLRIVRWRGSSLQTRGLCSSEEGHRRRCEKFAKGSRRRNPRRGKVRKRQVEERTFRLVSIKVRSGPDGCGASGEGEADEPGEGRGGHVGEGRRTAPRFPRTEQRFVNVEDCIVLSPNHHTRRVLLSRLEHGLLAGKQLEGRGGLGDFSSSSFMSAAIDSYRGVDMYRSEVSGSMVRITLPLGAFARLRAHLPSSAAEIPVKIPWVLASFCAVSIASGPEMGTSSS